ADISPLSLHDALPIWKKRRPASLSARSTPAWYATRIPPPASKRERRGSPERRGVSARHGIMAGQSNRLFAQANRAGFRTTASRQIGEHTSELQSRENL